MTELKDKIVFITGASSGIGQSCAWIFAKNGTKLILCARRIDRLKHIAQQLKNEFGTKSHIIQLDVRDREAVNSTLDNLPAEWINIDILLNNAGLARGLSKLHEGLIDDWEEMIDTNIKGLLYISRKLIPGMVERGKGDIINIGSIAGKEVYPQGNVYCASKYAVDALTKGMRLDLAPYGIKVSEINPGLVNTEFSMVRFKGDAVKSEQVYRGMDPLLAEDIAETVLFILSRPAHVNIAEMLVLPRAQASATQVSREN